MKNKGPYGVLYVPHDPKVDELLKDAVFDVGGPYVPDGKPIIAVTALTDEGEEFMKCNTLEEARGIADAMNMAFEYGRRYQNAHKDEDPNTPYVERELFTKESLRTAADSMIRLDNPNSQ